MFAILAAVMLAAAPQHDTVYTADGGRIVGTVIEEGPQGIAIRLPDGTFRRLARREVTRIEYADGSVSTIRPAEPPPSTQPPAAQPPSQAPPPSPPPPPRYPPPYPPPRYIPAPPPHPRPWPAAPVNAFYFAFGLAGAFPFGEVEDGVDVDRVFDPQFDVDVEGGLRLTPHLALGLYLDLGFGNAGGETSVACRAAGFACDAYRTRFGVLARYTFAPAARVTPWLSAGTGYEWAKITANGYGDEQFSYRGWEVLRLEGGIDLRSSPVFGFGLFGGVAFGRYHGGEDALGDFDIDRERFHTTVKAGVRFTLFP